MAAQRTEPGRIIDYGELRLDSGEELSFDIRWDMLFPEGARVLVTLGPKQKVVQVALDLRAIGMSPEQASSLAEIQAHFDAMITQGSLTADQREAFGAAIDTHPESRTKAGRKLRDRIERTLSGDTLPITDDDPWAEAARKDLAKIAKRDAWLGLLTLEGDGSKPTKKFTAAAKAHVQAIGIAAYVETVRRWFALVAPRPVVRDQGDWYAPAMGDANSDALKNLVWACGTIDQPRASEQLAVAIGDLAVRCFTKIRGVGALSTKAGNACIYVLSQLPGLRAVAQLSRLGSRVRYKQALALVEKAKSECAQRAGVSAIDLEELSLPAFDLDVEGRTRIEVGDYTAQLAVVDDKVEVTWFDGKKRLKAVPAALKSTAELAELKSTQKELAALVPTVRARLERWLLEPRAWSLADLRARYLDHPLVARLARRLIFTTAKTSVIFFDGFPLGVKGKEVALADDAQLSLWHPLGRPTAEVAEWRRFLVSLDVTQPFKQVDREIYLADEEKPSAQESKRFAGRTVRQHQLAALLRERGWTYSLMGTFDSANSPTKHVASYDLDVVLDVDVAEDAATSAAGIYVEVVTGNVRFVRNGRSLKLRDVPARCFSEVLRDVDLFASAPKRGR